MLSPIKVNSNTIELIVHTACYPVLDLLCYIPKTKKIARYVQNLQKKICPIEIHVLAMSQTNQGKAETKSEASIHALHKNKRITYLIYILERSDRIIICLFIC